MAYLDIEQVGEQMPANAVAHADGEVIIEATQDQTRLVSDICEVVAAPTNRRHEIERVEPKVVIRVAELRVEVVVHVRAEEHGHARVGVERELRQRARADVERGAE